MKVNGYEIKPGADLEGADPLLLGGLQDEDEGIAGAARPDLHLHGALVAVGLDLHAHGAVGGGATRHVIGGIEELLDGVLTG